MDWICKWVTGASGVKQAQTQALTSAPVITPKITIIPLLARLLPAARAQAKPQINLHSGELAR